MKQPFHRVAAATLGAALAIGTGVALADDWEIAAETISLRGEVANIVPERQQVAVMQRWIEWKLANVLPAVLERNGSPVWVLLRAKAPAYLMLLDANAEGMYLERPWALVVRLDGAQVERQRASSQEDLGGLLTALDPEAIAVSEEDRAELEAILGPTLHSRLSDSLVLEQEFLQEFPPDAISVFEHVARVAYEVYAQAFSNLAVIPDVTTSDDLNWWIRDRYKALGLETFDHPTVTVQRSEEVRAIYPEREGSFQIAGPPRNGYDVVLRRGDLIFADTGIKYFGLNTDTQQCAYILRQGETEMPAGLQRAFTNGLRLQDLVVAEARPERTGAEVYEAAMAKAREEQLRPDVYSHPLPQYLMRYEQNGFLSFFDRFGAGPEIGDSGDGEDPRSKLRIGRNTVYALELDVLYAVPEWEGQDIRMHMETNIAVTDGGVRFLGGRQTSCYLIR